MDLRQLTPELAVSSQISPAELPALAEAGFKVLINNRPDDEVGSEESHETMRSAAEAAGLRYFFIPFIPGRITPEMISAQAEALAGPGAKVAYCRSGNRSAVLWALTRAGQEPADSLLGTAAQAGYDLSGLRPMIESLASREG
ncbi:TIGR01244 family protein [Paracoccus halophilus]|uniref:TIGR01244 family protein n=1 Tax=Paracoccus halophilus TaxID=376733 RepID=A0A099F4P5_9RHOB|nr:protein tyrosine phosphatase family protein [Paracoccus halophilus]KGJ05176.1 hypothetical protein IT41_07275 [Paracoccus halophilus]SFA43729.1 TIGR01244 family protein [Paracoccus halophilus]